MEDCDAGPSVSRTSVRSLELRVLIDPCLSSRIFGRLVDWHALRPVTLGLFWAGGPIRHRTTDMLAGGKVNVRHAHDRDAVDGCIFHPYRSGYPGPKIGRQLNLYAHEDHEH